jgi:hypothetical protein
VESATLRINQSRPSPKGKALSAIGRAKRQRQQPIHVRHALQHNRTYPPASNGVVGRQLGPQLGVGWDLPLQVLGGWVSSNRGRGGKGDKGRVIHQIGTTHACACFCVFVFDCFFQSHPPSIELPRRETHRSSARLWRCRSSWGWRRARGRTRASRKGGSGRGNGRWAGA